MTSRTEPSQTNGRGSTDPSAKGERRGETAEAHELTERPVQKEPDHQEGMLVQTKQRYPLRLRILSGLFCAALVVASCGDDDDGDGDAAPEDEGTEEEASEEGSESEAAGTDTEDEGSDSEAAGTDTEGGENADYQALLDAANEEGSVVIYASTNPQTLENIQAAFEEAHPDISLEFLRESSSVIEERVAGERDAGEVGADVVMTSNRFWAAGEIEEGGAVPVEALEAGNEEFEDACVADEGFVIGGTDIVGIVYNPDLVEDPQSLDDFVGIDGGIADPSTSSVPLFLFETFGWDWMEDVASSDSNIVINPGAPDTINAVGAGEQNWGVANATQVVPVREEGAPVELFVPNPAPGFIIPAVALSDAPNPAAAQVLLNFIISQEGQEAIVSNGAGASCRDDVPTALETPDDLVLFSAEHVSDDFVEENQALFDEYFG